jgi:hypothetical protein
MPKPTRKTASGKPKPGELQLDRLRADLRNAYDRSQKRATEIRRLRYALMEEKKRADANEATVLAGISQQLAQTLGLAEPFPIVPEIHRLLARVATTNAWTQLAHERLTAVLGGADTRPTLGGVLALIERLIEQHVHVLPVRLPAEALIATAPDAADRLTVTLGAVEPPDAEDSGMHRRPCEDLDGSKPQHDGGPATCATCDGGGTVIDGETDQHRKCLDCNGTGHA